MVDITLQDRHVVTAAEATALIVDWRIGIKMPIRLIRMNVANLDTNWAKIWFGTINKAKATHALEHGYSFVAQGLRWEAKTLYTQYIHEIYIRERYPTAGEILQARITYDA